MARSTNGNYYTNPAFCQQSEFYNYQNEIHSRTQISPRKPPIGAQTAHRVLDHSVHDLNHNDSYEEQDFYEEMVIDDAGIVKEKKIVVVSQTQNEGRKYIQSQQNLAKECEVTYSASEERVARNHRYEYIPMTEHITPVREKNFEETQVAEANTSRYAVIDVDVDTESTSRGRYALVPIEELRSSQPSQIQRATARMKSTPNLHRYEYIDDMAHDDAIDQECSHSRTYSRNRISRNNSPTKTPIHSPIPRAMSPRGARYDYIQEPAQERYIQNYGNMTPTQKLHEILSTPKRTPVRQQTPKSMSSTSFPRQPQNIPRTPVINDPFITPKKISPKKKTPSRNPKAQQKLNYSIGSRQMTPNNKKHTAIIAPICSSPVQSVYSETTYSNKTESWMNISVEKPPVQATLAVAALMMVVCGGLSSGMCFYMMSLIGKVYYLEFGIVSGFGCLTLGILGFRTRHCSWLPNRNYISGYIVLSVFSLLTCAALLILLFMQPRPGTPLADMTSGAVCAISVLSLCLATTGVLSSYCCSVPPPDNRVQHCAQGFIV
ncbi:uncharacterized protein LOC123307338 [Coccinella septempunctata]|uniref:uncharacterized protein LOC123307338 n=1 Tax=Coccinella septempunctata TaxID=41139 RepID=UPI001D083796|nr:uncharacterized protein LOC123307338 [Coccinella septempunctata]